MNVPSEIGSLLEGNQKYPAVMASMISVYPPLGSLYFIRINAICVLTKTAFYASAISSSPD
jgi:hypothetical protein